jgi:hypothetical protein
LLMGQWGFAADDALVFLSVQGNSGLCQACHPNKVVPKSPMCPKAFPNVGKLND